MGIDGGSDRSRGPPGFYERIKGGLLYGSLVYTWLFGLIAIPLALVLLLVWRDFTLVLVLLVYYGFRALFPAKEWALFNGLYRTGKARYFTRADTLFEGFKSLEPDSGRLICVHPHGILTIGWAYISCDPVLLHAKIKWLVTEALLALPFISDFLSWNNFAMATKQYMQARMKKKVNMGLLPGGFEEATLFKRGCYRVYIEKRKGFVALALRHGYKLHPAFVFGEEKTYWAFSGLLKQRLWLNKFKLPGVIFVGALGLLPYWDIEMTTVVGPAIQLPTVENPTSEDVDKYHKVYKDALVGLFERHKAAFASPGATLEIY